MAKEPDLLISPDGRRARSVSLLTEDEIRDYENVGWSRVPFAQHVDDIAPRIIDAALAELAAERGARQ